MKTLLILLTAAAAMTFYAPTLSKAQIGIDVPGVGVRIGEPNRDRGVYRDRREFRGREVRGSEGVRRSPSIAMMGRGKESGSATNAR